ncbi:MAG: sterol desaturase family protein [Planctomycetes bacterium]|nr:sterol desaturase family protein [Planctomycetota bacterium]
MMLSIPVAVMAWAANNFVPAVILETTAAWPFWVRVLASAVVGEIGYYWGHRWSHEVPFLWRFHCIHHSAEDLDYLVATRAHPIDFVFGRICMYAPMLVLGLTGPGKEGEVQIPLYVSLFGMFVGFFIHANVRWRFGFLEWIIATPGFHHWHHTKYGPINHNYSSTFPWVDWIFRTAYLPKNQSPESFGIGATIPESLIGQLVYPFENPKPGDFAAAMAAEAEPASAVATTEAESPAAVVNSTDSNSSEVPPAVPL